ncbi:MAG TPA: RDD family protein [Lysobacter sp.]|nr:RDD family protein [Lysobacter sp.]
MAAAVPPHPAGFWQRSVAWSLDAAMIAPLAAAVAWPFMSVPAQALPSRTTALLQTAGQAMAEAIVDVVPVPQLAAVLLHNPALHQASVDLQSTLWSATWPLLLAFALLSGAYHIACESSRRQATPGQRLLGLRVVDPTGHALTPGRALARHLAGSLSWATLNIGHLMATIEPQRLALHDRLSATRVVKSGPMATGDAGLPTWALVWLWALGIGVIALTAWGIASAMTVMRIALEQALF